MSFLDKVKKGLRKLDSYLDKAEEILEGAQPLVAVTYPAALPMLATVLGIVQLVEDLTPDAEAATEAEFKGAAKLELAAEMTATAAPRLGVSLGIADARDIVQAVVDAAKKL